MELKTLKWMNTLLQMFTGDIWEQRFVFPSSGGIV